LDAERRIPMAGGFVIKFVLHGTQFWVPPLAESERCLTLVGRAKARVFDTEAAANEEIARWPALSHPESIVVVEPA
jgi:hypothetical protein